METLIHGDCLEKLKEIPDNSIDSIVTDPPYGLSFMGKKWDYDVPSIEIWKECLRVLKPGGYLLSFAGTRTQHRMAVRIEDAGFEIRDMIAWVYGSGFPKSLNIGKAVDKLQGNEREMVGTQMLGGNAAQSIKEKGGTYASNTNAVGVKPIEVTLTKGTSEWEGWGTALKPALEPITVARKPIEGTVAENCLKWGVGGINIDDCRVGTEEIVFNKPSEHSWSNAHLRDHDLTYKKEIRTGRFPANLIHDGSEEVVELFPNESQRFFYCAKASKKDRDEGLEGNDVSNRPFEERKIAECAKCGNRGLRVGSGKQLTCGHTEIVYKDVEVRPAKNGHPTVKPTALMRYLVKLVTPPGGTVLDPFTGSGSTGKACKLEGFEFIGIEREEEYVKIAKARIEAVSYTPTLL